MINHSEINEYIILMLRHQVPISEFEKWLYHNEEILEEYLGKQMYFELININYKSKFVMDVLESLLVNILDYKSSEEFKIKDLLIQLINNEDQLIKCCRKIYDEYCRGYHFFRIIALKFIVYDYDGQLDSEKNRKEFEKDRLEFVTEGTRLLHFIESNKIEIQGEYEYIDLRTNEERLEEKYWS